MRRNACGVRNNLKWAENEKDCIVSPLFMTHYLCYAYPERNKKGNDSTPLKEIKLDVM